MPDAPVPPQNLDAEESVLGAIMLSPKAFEKIQDTGLQPGDFYRESHGKVFRVATEMLDAGEPVDAITLTDELEQRGILEEVGGRSRIHELASLMPVWANAGHYAGIVRETAQLRRLIVAGDAIARLGWERPGELDVLLARAEEFLSAAVIAPSRGFGEVGDELAELVAEIEEAIETGKPKIGLRTGFLDLDRILLGFHPGQLILVAARPAMGKSALGLNIAENVADRQIPVGYHSLEMSTKELLVRSLSRAASVDSKRISTGKLEAPQVDAFRDAVKKVEARKEYLLVEDNPAITIQQLRAEARRLHRQRGLGLLVVDYLQLMLSSQTQDNRQQEVSVISRNLKLLARELNIPVVAISQLNRNLEIRTDKRPMLSDLRDSGSLEQDADVVIFVYRDEYYSMDSEAQGIAELIVAKNRRGETNTAKLAFVSRFTEFRNLAVGIHGTSQEAA